MRNLVKKKRATLALSYIQLSGEINYEALIRGSDYDFRINLKEPPEINFTMQFYERHAVFPDRCLLRKENRSF